MEQILNEYCKQFNPGLLLLSMPTGSGKTYNVLNFIYSNYEEFAAQNRKILFITNLKKNLPISELKERFITDAKEDTFNKYVLFIDSNIDTVTQNLFAVDDEIPDQFKTEVYKKLKFYIKTLQYRQLPKEIKDSLETEIRKNIEPKFRKPIIEALKNNFKTKKASKIF
ncbi:DEAD/DEAH box helicase family protein [Nostoc sp.]|uniref:DEAD/DEAH box helicase family protein n=1 Tax=Nostoc sp. TaxID=1180 RepID=UPI002FF5DFA6